MSKRMVVVGGATAVAGLVLGASIVFGPDPVDDRGGTPTGTVQAPDLNQPGSNRGATGLDVYGFSYEAFEANEQGELRGMRLVAERGVIRQRDVTRLDQPRAEIWLGQQRGIIITADNADMTMDDKTPREGQFSGNVIITLLQAPPDTRLILDPTDPAHEAFVQQRIYLDDTTSFSIEADTITTAGPVHVTSPQVDFYGIGLHLAYNTQRERIETLDITQGRYLIYNPDAQTPDFDIDDAQAATDPPAQDTPQQDEPAPSQFYNITFRDQVVIRDGTESELGGDQLIIAFSLGTDAVTIDPIERTGTGLPAIITLTHRLLAQADATDAIADDADAAAVDAQPQPLQVIRIPDKNRDRSLFDHDAERDIVVLWQGQMLIDPLENKPEILADEDDVHVTLTGENTYAQTTRSGELERLDANTITYLLSQERITAQTTDDQPIRIVSTDLGGELIGQELTVEPQRDLAIVQGPGQLTYTDQEHGKELTATWQNQLAIELFTQARADEVEQADEQNDPPADEPDTDAVASADTVAPAVATTVAQAPDPDTRTRTEILGLKTATFDGQVTARHTDFDLDTHTLTIAFNQPNEQLDIDNSPREINAAGDVSVHVRGDADDETFAINAQSLTIEIRADENHIDNELYASTINAQEDVRVHRPGSTFTCNGVRVELKAPSETPDTQQPQGEDPQNPSDRFAQVRSIFAIQDVRAEIDHEGRRIDLVADQLFADVENDRLTLSADHPDAPAEIIDITDDRILTGQTVVMDDRADQLTIAGPGTLATRIADPNQPDAGIEDAYLNIQWTRGMSFNNVTGDAQFAGNVASQSRRSTDSTDLTCDSLAMRFSPDYEHDPVRLIEDDGEDAHGDRQIRSAIATGDAEIQAASWDPLEPEQILSRMVLAGPVITFTNQPAIAIGQTPTETIVVSGEGRLQLEDYREPETNQAAAANEDENEDSPSLTGRGITLFNWQQSMVLDAQTNTATFLDTVQMTHLPIGQDDQQQGPVQLDANRLVADLTDNGGLGVWLSDDAPDARVTTVTADDNVRVLQHRRRSMQADHLLFNAETNLLEMWSDNNGDVNINDLVRNVNTRTNRVTWDLTANTLEIDEVRGGVVPGD